MNTGLRFCTVLLVYGFCHGIAEAVLYFETADFEKIASTLAFVDKTLFIREVIHNQRTAVITAPPKFGKSTNLNMLETFLEIEVNRDGSFKSAATEPHQLVNDTDNYKLFVVNKLKVADDPETMKHLGKTPVLSVSFRCDRDILSLEDAVTFYRQVVHQAFKKYRYLLDSPRLGADFKQYFQMWVHDHEYQMFGKHKVTDALRELAEYLWRHFDRKVFLLIDDHDSVTNRAMMNVTDEKALADIVKYSVSMVYSALKNYSLIVKGGLITGVSDVPTLDPSKDNDDQPDYFHRYRFLEDHRFVDFYGMTRDEFEYIMVITDKSIEAARQMYNGYMSKNGREVYNMVSVLRFMQTAYRENYWTRMNLLPGLSAMVRVPVIKDTFKKLVKGKNVSVEVPEVLRLEDVVELKKLMRAPECLREGVVNKLLSFLLEQGYLSYVPGATGSAVRLPNEEIREELKKYVKKGPSK